MLLAQLRRRPFVVHSPLSVSECLFRLEVRTNDSYSAWDPYPDGASSHIPPMIGRIRGQRVRLGKLPRYRKNPFMPFFRGRLEQEGSGSRLEGSFAAALYTRVFIVVWFSGLAAATLAV